LDKATFETVAIIFALGLPGSVYCSAVCLMAAGLFRESWEQPLVFRVVSRGDFPAKNRAGMFVTFAGLLISLNAFPALLVVDPVASQWTKLGWAYFAVLGLWFAYVVFATFRARSTRRSLTAEDLAELTASSAPRTCVQALIDQLDFEDAVESGVWTGGKTYPLPPQLGQLHSDRGLEVTADELGEPCTVYPVDWQGMSPKFDLQAVADSFEGSFVLELAKAVKPRFPVAGSRDSDLVIRSRVLRADPGNQFLRWLFPFIAGSAVFEVEAEIADSRALIAKVRAHGKRRLGFHFGGDSEEMLADAAKLAGERAAVQLMAALEALRPSS
jgi:hypothetical protein